MDTTAERIRTNGLTKRFSNGTLGLEALTLTVRQGEFVCLFGGPGAGKSTALHIIAGLMKPSFGTVMIDGTDVSDSLETKGRVTLIASDWNHPPRLTPIESLRTYVALNGIQASVHECRNALRDGGIPESAMLLPARTLPAEHKLATWLALARITRRQVLLLDDPASGLDIVAVSRLIQQLESLRRDTATLVATANPVLAAHADRCIVLIDGRPVLQRSRGEFTAQSLASTYFRLWGSRESN